MGHHLPQTYTNILHRKNTGRSRFYLEVRKFDQCHWPVYLSSDTHNNYQAFISKTLLALSFRFCDKVTNRVTSEEIFYLGLFSHQWGHEQVTFNVPMYHALINTLSLSPPHSMEQEICKSECGIEVPWRKRFFPVLLPNESHGPRRVPRTY